MADLLGPRLEDMSALEAAMLMLSAYFHDIGMVFKEEERANLAQEAVRKTFLERHPDAFIAVQQSGVTRGIAERYCRWRHADRVVVYLDNLPDEALRWGVASLREPLAALCRSHNESPKHIADSDLLETRFLVDADLKLCAVLLRLADILDFDRARSPDAVYGHLGLARRDTARNAGSDVEWRKHLASEGFRFPHERPSGYALDFIASPDEPAVEHDLRRFLDVIDAELKSCTALLAHCPERWRSLTLPGQIDRRSIKPQGYRFGEHRFTLDQQQVLDLLMGENLYESPYAFVRELLQNAIDTTGVRGQSVA